MQYLKIRNWDRWQSYRKDRGQPPWIKIHRRLLRNPEWVSLSDAERGQLVVMWLLAADHDGVIPASSDVIQKLCFMTEPPNINKFVELDFIDLNGCQLDANMTPERRQHDAPKSKAETKAKAEESQPTPPVETPSRDEPKDENRPPEQPEKKNGHYANQVGEFLEQINSACKQIGNMKLKKPLNPWGVVQVWVNKQIHPGAICEVLNSCTKLKHGTNVTYLEDSINPPGYIQNVMKIVGANYHEREFATQGEQEKNEWAEFVEKLRKVS